MKELFLPITKEREELSLIVESTSPLNWDFSKVNADLKIDEKLRSYVNQTHNLRSAMDCVAYCFGRNYSSTPEVMDGLYHSAEKVDRDKAIYAWYTQEGKPVHVGKLLSNNKVKSKWGRGHIVTHELDMVPANLGDKVEFSRDIPDYVLNVLWSDKFGE